MLTTEIKVNGIIIGVLSIYNTGVKHEKGTMYQIEAYVPSDDGIGGRIIEAGCIHNRDDGAIILVQKAIDSVVAKMKL